MKNFSRLNVSTGKIWNSIAFFSFATILGCLLSPSYQILDPIDITKIILAPVKFILYIPLNFLSSLSNFSWDSLAWLLWLSILLIWVYSLSNARLRLKQFRWWIIPLLAGILSLTWATHLVLWLNFTLYKPELEKLADRVKFATSQNKVLEFNPSQKIGILEVLGVYRVYDPSESAPNNLAISPTTTNITSIEIEGKWAHQGFVRDLSRKAGGFQAINFRLAPGSNNGDQNIFYLGEGWYAFQNLFD
ncbi:MULTISPECIES: hypothetical protein [unclassified Microcoleus]|uniref:hypothetical protein n=1 Tax=unclassified Microcoleus TaxID=2642155 RepID=UPI002FD75DEB